MVTHYRKRHRFLMLGWPLLFLLVSCAAFPYKWYGIDAASYEGTLLGPKESQDRPFAVCEPDDEKGKCVVMLKAEFEKLMADHIEALERLKECEKR